MLVLPLEDVAAPDEALSDDPLHDLMTEFSAFEAAAEAEATQLELARPAVVTADMREDFAWVALERQLMGLKDGLNRLHFYLSDVDDNLRR